MKKPMFWLFAGFLPLFAILLTSHSRSNPEKAPEVVENAATEALIKEGERLIHVLDCNICHSPKVFTDQGPRVDESRMLSGHPADMALPEIDKNQVGPGKWSMTNDHFTAWVGAWGISYAANITPDATGIGSWTLDHFKKAVREGKAKGLEGSRTLLPPMPWPAYSQLTDHELEAMFTYLQSIPPVSNVVPLPVTPDKL